MSPLPARVADPVPEGAARPPVFRRPRRRPPFSLRPGWPLTTLYVGFPIWWALGLSQIIFFVAATAMVAILYKQRPVRTPRWFGLWLLFLVWMFAGVFVLWARAPGTLPESGLGNLVGFVVRAGWYVAGTIALLYVVNVSRTALPSVKIARLLAWMFIVTAGLGLAGVLAPQLEFPSLVELMLPRSMTSSNFVQSMIHPSLASGSDFLGYSQPRPTAPFPYANAWGNNLALFLPFFIYAWFGPEAGWRRTVAPVVLAGAMFPIVYSLNRGLWLAISVAALYAALRLALNGRVKMLMLLVTVILAGGVVFVSSPLYDTITLRIETPHSNERRTSVATDVITTTAEGSPLVGYGTTRHKQGSYSSLAGGETPQCHQCAPPPLGTQGFMWRLILTTGFVGTALCLTFFGLHFLRRSRGVEPLDIVCCAVLLIGVTCFFVYDSLGSATFTMMLAVGLMSRSRKAAEPGVTH